MKNQKTSEGVSNPEEGYRRVKAGRSKEPDSGGKPNPEATINLSRKVTEKQSET